MIRLLTAADAAEAAALIRIAFGAQDVQTDPPSSALRETTDTIAAALVSGGGAAALISGALVGCVLWAAGEDGLYIGRLAVLPNVRRQGIARALVDAVQREAYGQCLQRLHLKARLQLPGNRRLFAACGFREVGAFSHPGYAAPTYVVMEKILPDETEPAFGRSR